MEQGKNKGFKKIFESDIEDANVCSNLRDKEAEDDDFVAVV